MNIKIDVSIGEFFDKITILQIKQERILDAEKLENIVNELERLLLIQKQSNISVSEIKGLIVELKDVNEKLWDIEDLIRKKELEKSFDKEFVELARSVYMVNDKRSDIKRNINIKTGSHIVEEKSYEKY